MTSNLDSYSMDSHATAFSPKEEMEYPLFINSVFSSKSNKPLFGLSRFTPKEGVVILMIGLVQ